MRTPRCRAVEILFLLLLALPCPGSTMSLGLRSPKVGDSLGLAVALTGVVVDEKEKPVAGAEVEAFVPDASWDPRRQRTLTDAVGRFLIPEIEEGCLCSLRVSRHGFAPALLNVTPRRSSEVRLTLGRGATVSGTVVDEKGSPVRGARVDLFPVNDSGGPRDTRLYRATSGADGRFEIPYVPERRYELRVFDRDHPLFQESLTVRQGSRRLDLGRLGLSRGRHVTGQVLDPQGSPAAGVPISVLDLSDPARAWSGEDDARLGPVAVTGPDGRFDIPGVAPVVILQSCPSGYPAQTKFSVPATPQPLRIVLAPAPPPPPRASGRVLDEAGRPVPGARVRRGDPASHTARLFWSVCKGQEAPADETVADAEGRFSLQLEDNPTFVLWAIARGYLREVRTGASSASKNLDIVLSRGVTLSGRVFARDGSPAAGAKVYAGQDGRAPETLTDARGRYRLTGVQPGTRELWAEHPELGQARRRLEVTPGAHRLDLTLDGQRERAIRGRVTGPDGEPLAGVRVATRDDLSTHTREDGSFRLVFPRGTLLLYEETTPLGFTKTGYASAVQTIKASETPIDGLEIHLEKGWPLTGNILGVEPEQIQSVSVEARRSGGEVQVGRVDQDGTYRIGDLEPGTWTVAASLGNQTAHGAVEIGPGEASLDLRLPSLREVRGRVLDPHGNPVSSAVVIFQNPDGEDGFTPVDLSGEDGTFSIQLAEGVYRVRGSHDDWAPASLEKPLVVASRPIDGLEIRLKPGAVLQGRVLGMPEDASATLSITSPDPVASNQVDVEADGSYRFPGLETGEWEVEATASLEGSQRIGKARITLAPGEREKLLDFDLSFGNLTLSGHLDSGGEPLSTNVSLLKPDGETLIEDVLIEDEENGDFRLPALRPGSYILRIKDYYRDRIVLKPVELSSDQTVTIDLLHP